MAPVYASDHAATREAEEPEISPRTWLSVLGLLWVLSGWLAAREVLAAGASPVGVAVTAMGAGFPLLLVRVRGSRDLIPRALWAAAATAYLAGLGTIAATVADSPLDGFPARLVWTTEAAVSSLVFGCGAYIVSRTIGSVRAERKAIYVGSAFVLAFRLATVAAIAFVFHENPGALYEHSALWILPMVLVTASLAPVVWTYVRLLAARPHLKRITRVFE